MDAAATLAGIYLAFWILTPGSLAIDCLHAKAQCNEDQHCALMLIMLNELCGNSGLETTCDAPDRLQCEGFLQILRQTQSFEMCECDPMADSYATCHDVYRQMHRIPCSESVDEGQQGTPTEPAPDSTCIRALDSCNGDVTCRQGLFDYLTECYGDPFAETCRTTDCRRSIRSFLDSVSPVYTHALLYCYCAAVDPRCDMVLQGLNAKCAYQITPPPNCLDIKQQCLRSTMCSTNFENYEEQCAPSDTSGTGCAKSYSACRKARLGILGTVVAASCTCRGLEGPESKACADQRLLVMDNSCFIRASRAFYPSAQNQGDKPTSGPKLSIMKRFQEGCKVNLVGSDKDVEMANVHITAGQHIRISSSSANCTQICTCQSQGYLSNCFDVLCNLTHSCPKEAQIARSNTKECVCAGRQHICIDKEAIPKNIDHPVMVVAYSVMEYGLIQRQLHVDFTHQSFLEKMQQTLSTVHLHRPCKLTIETGTRGAGFDHAGLFMVNAHHEQRQDWECLNQMSDLAMLINARATAVSTDVILSTIKLATVVEGAGQHQSHSNSSYAHSSAACVLLRVQIGFLFSSIIITLIEIFD